MGRKKKYSSEEEKRLVDSYKKYVKSYMKAKSKFMGNIGRMLDFENYKNYFYEAEKTYDNLGTEKSKRRINYNIISSQKLITKKQAMAYSKNLKKNIKKWSKQDPYSLSPTQKDIIRLLDINNFDIKDMTYKFWYYLEGIGQELVDYLNSNDSWEEAIGS